MFDITAKLSEWVSVTKYNGLITAINDFYNNKILNEHVERDIPGAAYFQHYGSTMYRGAQAFGVYSQKDGLIPGYYNISYVTPPTTVSGNYYQIAMTLNQTPTGGLRPGQSPVATGTSGEPPAATRIGQRRAA